MSKIVFVLGAGASAHCGTPLMGNFLEVAEALWRRGEVKEVSEHFKKVFEAIGYLQGIHSKALLDTYNIETIYAAFEMGKLLNSLPGLEEMSLMEGKEPQDLLEELISSIKKVIAHTLELTMRFGREIRPPQAYKDFVDIIDILIEKKIGCSIITFNYDLGLDYSLFKAHTLIDYGLGDITAQAGKKRVTLLKLHGSLNWGKCNKCGRIIPYKQFDRTLNFRGYSILSTISELPKIVCCEKSLETDPFIVPPTWNKTAYHTQIEPVWKRAALELNDAENIFVLGYSLPSTDLFFNYLFALGVNMRTILKGFYVYNPDGEVEERFRNLIGSGIIQRFQFERYKFEDSFPYLNVMLGL